MHNRLKVKHQLAVSVTGDHCMETFHRIVVGYMKVDNYVDGLNAQQFISK